MDQIQPMVEQRLIDLFAGNTGATRPQPFLQADPAENKLLVLKEAARAAAGQRGLTFVDARDDQPATQDQLVFRALNYANEVGPWSQDTLIQVTRGLNRTLSGFHQAGAGVLVLDGVFDNQAVILKQVMLRLTRPQRLASLGLHGLSVVWGARRGTEPTGEPQDLEGLERWSWTPTVSPRPNPGPILAPAVNVESLARDLVQKDLLDETTVQQHFGNGVLQSQQHFGYDLAQALVRQAAARVRSLPETLGDTVRRLNRGLALLDDGQFTTAVETLPRRLLSVLPAWADAQDPDRLAPVHQRAVRQAFATDPRLPEDRRQAAVDTLGVRTQPHGLAHPVPPPSSDAQPSRRPRMA